MKIKTSEMVAPALDWAVECALTGRVVDIDDFVMRSADESYATEWAQGGPIIEREIHAFDHMQSDRVCAMIRRKDMKNGGWNFGYGPTALIAAMRCYVASKLGDEVDVPEELLK